MLDKKITYTEILKLIEDLLASDGIDTKVDEEMQLIGGDSVLDSMKLVELCIALEERCKSYYAYLKSTGKQPSTEVLLQLWAQLRLAEKQVKTKNKSKHYFFKKRQPNQFQKTTREMSNKVLDELLARSTVICTPPNPSYNQLN